MKRALFVVHTEYHMLGAISIFKDLLKDWKIDIVQTKNRHSKRFSFNKNISSLGKNVTYIELDTFEACYKFNPQLNSLISSLMKKKIDKFFSFNRLAHIDFLLIKLLSKNGTKIILAPDGTIAYGRITGFTPRWSLKVSIDTHKFLWVNGFKKVHPYWPTLRYGYLKEIDELIAPYPKFVDSRSRKKVVKMNFLESTSALETAFSFFSFKRVRRTNVILYLNQPFKKDEIYTFELFLLKRLRDLHPEKKLIVKLHPTTSKKQKVKFYDLPGVEVLDNTIPAELLIINLVDSIICSFWSTSVLMDNSSCRFYWLYPILKAENIMLKKIKVVNPAKHVRIIEDVKEIK